MAQTPEGKVKFWLYGTKKDPGRLYHYFPGAYTYKPPGGMFGSTGAPDGFHLWRGVFLGLEVKAEGNGPTALQLRHLRAINEAGGVGAVIIGRDENRLRAIYEAVMAKVGRDEPQG